MSEELNASKTLEIPLDTAKKALWILKKQVEGNVFSHHEKNQLLWVWVNVDAIKNKEITTANLQELAKNVGLENIWKLQTGVAPEANNPDYIIGVRTLNRLRNFQNDWKDVISWLKSMYRAGMSPYRAKMLLSVLTGKTTHISSFFTQEENQLINQKLSPEGDQLPDFIRKLTAFCSKQGYDALIPEASTGDVTSHPAAATSELFPAEKKSASSAPVSDDSAWGSQ